jgi:hypothetical protein
MTGWGYALADRRSREQRDAMDSRTFVKRVAELSGVDKEIAERVVRATLLNLGTRIDPGGRPCGAAAGSDRCLSRPQMEGATLSTERIHATGCLRRSA